MQKKLNALIVAKQKATLAIALSVVNNNDLKEQIKHKSIPKNFYKELIAKFKEHTLYKNIWIQIVDSDLNSIYKSWSESAYNNKISFRNDIRKAIKEKSPVISINSGVHSLSLRSIVPLIEEGRVIGALEVISHFNSIAKELEEFEVDSVVVLAKERNGYLKKPFTKIFIDNYYIANFNAPSQFMEFLHKEGIENYFNSSHMVQDGHLIVSYEIKDIEDRVIGHYIMFKNIDKISDKNLDFFMLKWFIISAFVVLALAIIIGNYVYNKNKKQKSYYKNIIDSSSNMVLVVDKNSILDVNKIFFKYFDKYKTLEEFKKENSSISDFFVEEEGYVQRETEGKNWLEAVIENPKNNQVKIIYDAKEYYFTVGVSFISKEDRHYSAIFSDITKEKLYQQELEHTNITDPLTKIKNRYYYNVQIKKESSNANRYFYPLSLVIFDIDHFKKINDSCGHDIGDAVLIEYTKLISSHLRDGDIFCRIGGEEFAFILPYVSKSDAYRIADKVRAKVEAHKKIFAVTMSFGVTEYIKGEDLEVTFKRADKALYEAKNAGRNKVVVR
ncbi:MAG: diguanylate cyclase [Sulfurimonas sp.]|uniref:diguanylate cyclase n=1 Tax=Sulfurimonas sp. TaxID=2022749 RepID=UPI0028CF8905|nr:diguanylate cyclase [Sulfurimonas sp.]MDT8337758.1 diguanylate cyclase [Sulfurimonas sp.]